jgi:hypothetical protein
MFARLLRTGSLEKLVKIENIKWKIQELRGSMEKTLKPKFWKQFKINLITLNMTIFIMTIPYRTRIIYAT